ncbi:MAG TPA: PadR family transcriptional regulator [Acidimicrobiales bacterium]|nr:PadR family transcriptional regulator [Acidimicrobiales bacterium]
MSLRHAILTALLDRDASGYELARHFDQSVANFWHALPAQLYPEINRLEADGLVDVTEVPQERRPTKRVLAINDAGRAELRRWVTEPSRPFTLKDELMVRVRSGADTEPASIVEALRIRRERSVAKLDSYVAARDAMLRGRTEAEFLASARRIGPYLTANAGIALEQGQLTWIDDTIAALTPRSSTDDGGQGSAGVTSRRAKP